MSPSDCTVIILLTIQIILNGCVEARDHEDFYFQVRNYPQIVKYLNIIQDMGFIEIII